MKRVGWWDKQCMEKKKQLRKVLKEWRREGGESLEYKKRNTEKHERKKEEENKRWKKKTAQTKRESEVWEIMNRERKRKKEIGKGIEMEDWKRHFMRLLERR